MFALVKLSFHQSHDLGVVHKVPYVGSTPALQKCYTVGTYLLSLIAYKINDIKKVRVSFATFVEKFQTTCYVTLSVGYVVLRLAPKTELKWVERALAPKHLMGLLYIPTMDYLNFICSIEVIQNIAGW